MFNTNKLGNSSLNSSFEQPVYQHQQQAKNIENNYLNKEYQKCIEDKLMKKQKERQQKKNQLQLYNLKKQQYLSDVANNRYQKQQQRQYMADQYENMIQQRKMKQARQKNNQKSYERDLLNYSSWVKDAATQRELYRQKNKSYSHELQEHVYLQQMRKQQQKQLQRKMRQKINEQAQQILEKQYQQLQQRSKRKSMFEMRQNQLLGISGDRQKNIDRSLNLSNSGLSITQDGKLQQISLRKMEQDIYGKGLDHQRHMYEQIKKKSMIQPKNPPHQGYNPITNPLPLVYKNPNVLRMLSQR